VVSVTAILSALPAEVTLRNAGRVIASPATSLVPPETRTSASCPEVGAFCRTPTGTSVIAAIAIASPDEFSLTN